MKTKGAILWGVGEEWSVEEIEIGDPREGEVTVQLAASGLCHSDEHLVTGGTPVASYPAIGGHEGAPAAIPELLSLDQKGHLNLDDLVTTRYALENIDQGYQDMREGKNIRGMIVYTDADH